MLKPGAKGWSPQQPTHVDGMLGIAEGISQGSVWDCRGCQGSAGIAEGVRAQFGIAQGVSQGSAWHPAGSAAACTRSSRGWAGVRAGNERVQGGSWGQHRAVPRCPGSPSGARSRRCPWAGEGAPLCPRARRGQRA